MKVRNTAGKLPEKQKLKGNRKSGSLISNRKLPPDYMQQKKTLSQKMEPAVNKAKLKLYVIEDGETYKELSKTIVQLQLPIELSGISNSHDIDTLTEVLTRLNPDVILIRRDNIDSEITNTLEMIFGLKSNIGIVLLIKSYFEKHIKYLRRLALDETEDRFFLLVEPVDRIEKLLFAILAVCKTDFKFVFPISALFPSNTPGGSFLKQFTDRELEILYLVSQGNTNSEIAETLNISITTVKRHVHMMYLKHRIFREFSDRQLMVTLDNSRSPETKL